MKDFNEFAAMVNQADLVGKVVDDVNLKFKVISPELNLGNQIAFISYQIAVELIGIYHKWINEKDQ